MADWEYAPEENPKRKHHWDKGYAGFIVRFGITIGKCPNNISMEKAEELINSGIEWSPPDWESKYPNRIYVVHEGAVYRAKPTNPGVSYHAFPETGANLRKLPRSVKQDIMRAAKEENCEKEVRRWFKQ